MSILTPAHFRAGVVLFPDFVNKTLDFPQKMNTIILDIMKVGAPYE